MLNLNILTQALTLEPAALKIWLIAQVHNIPVDSITPKMAGDYGLSRMTLRTHKASAAAIGNASIPSLTVPTPPVTATVDHPIPTGTTTPTTIGNYDPNYVDPFPLVPLPLNNRIYRVRWSDKSAAFTPRSWTTEPYSADPYPPIAALLDKLPAANYDEATCTTMVGNYTRWINMPGTAADRADYIAEQLIQLPALATVLTTRHVNWAGAICESEFAAKMIMLEWQVDVEEIANCGWWTT